MTTLDEAVRTLGWRCVRAQLWEPDQLEDFDGSFPEWFLDLHNEHIQSKVRTAAIIGDTSPHSVVHRVPVIAASN